MKRKLFVVLVIVLSLGASSQAKSKARKHSHHGLQGCPAISDLRKGCLYWTDVNICHVSVHCLNFYSHDPSHVEIQLVGGRDAVLIDGGSHLFYPDKFEEKPCDPIAPNPAPTPNPQMKQAFDNSYPPINDPEHPELYRYAHYTGRATKQDLPRACFKFHIKRKNNTPVDPHIIVTD